MSVTVYFPAALEVTAEFSNSSIAVEVEFAAPLEVAVTIGIGSTGTLDHSKLTEESRAMGGQHPIGAITGLAELLPTPDQLKAMDLASLPSIDNPFATVNDIPEIPAIPTKTSQLENDSNFITADDIPAIPTKTSELENDSGFITSAAIPTNASQITVDTPFTPANTPVVAGISAQVAFEKVQGQINDIKDNYLLKYTVPSNVASITLSVDKNNANFNFVEGDKIEIIYKLINSEDTIERFRINENTSLIYVRETVVNSSAWIISGTAGVEQFGFIDLLLLGNEALGSLINNTETAATSRAITKYGLKTVGLGAGISSFTFYVTSGTINQNSVIIIKKIK